MTMTMSLNTDATTQAIRRIKNAAPVAIARALNKSIASGKTIMVRAIAQDLGLKQADIRDNVLVTSAVPGPARQIAQLSASRKRIPLIAFNARGPVPSRGKGRGVRARMPGGAGQYPNAFIATVGTGRHTGVFQRRGKARLPIKELFGPSLGHVFDKYVPMALARAEEQLVKNLAHELQFAMSQTT